MSQVPNTSPSDANYEVANSTGANVRGDINNILDAILTMNSGSSAPSYAKAYTFFADTSAGIMKMRNAANDGFINLFTLTGGIDVDAASTFSEDVTFAGASANIIFDKSDNQLEFADNAKATFGNSADLEIFHSGTHSIIKENGTGNLMIGVSAFQVTNVGISETMIYAVPDGEVNLYFDNVIKLNTTSAGVSVSGSVVATGNVQVNDNNFIYVGNSGDLSFKHDTSNSFITNSATGGFLHIRSNSGINLQDSDGNENFIKCIDNGAVEIYNDNTKRLETFASGAKWTGQFQGPVAGDSIQWTGSSSNAFLMAMSDGNDLPANSSTNMNFHHWNGTAWKKSYEFGRDALLLPDNIKLRCGTSSDLSIFHNGTKSFLENITGDLIAKTASSIFLEPATNESGVAVNANSSVDLYFDNTKRFQTLTNGAQSRGIMHVLSLDGNVNQHTESLYFVIGTNSSTTFTLTNLIGSGRFVLGGYANAGQGALAFYVIFGGAMFATQHYQVNELINSGMQNISVSTSKNNTSYVVTITNSSSSSTLGISGFIESTGSRMAVATS